MPRPNRDSSFLFIAALAALGGTLAISLSIGLPIWSRLHGTNVSPVFSLFAAWGVAALAGAYASICTYFASGNPRRPPRGGVRLALVRKTDALRTVRVSRASRKDAA